MPAIATDDAAAQSVQVLTALRRIMRATDLHSKRLTKHAGLTIPQVVVLQAIRDLGEVTTGMLSVRVSLSQATVTSILDRLEERGLVERYRSTSDRRVVHARLTGQGRSVLRRAPSIRSSTSSPSLRRPICYGPGREGGQQGPPQTSERAWRWSAIRATCRSISRSARAAASPA
jgi:DNA-binding MarR family transcriptional regulator